MIFPSLDMGDIHLTHLYLFYGTNFYFIATEFYGKNIGSSYPNFYVNRQRTSMLYRTKNNTFTYTDSYVNHVYQFTEGFGLARAHV